ncbi:hypothetical protein [Cellulomonas cellasea]|uniref:Uncharacterized protein n=2 Tax=Cellulomonas cellasea TaxID=43670 RepID=A0A0A0B6A6_9CELL|nr:hypothetical protein [Cellulomonas cellasea]KGM01712.1 hypothetical protein Q760_17875 [Cellulomonas cellasea DSM 20118]GEA86995.1 hypothetical protein CCE01nite_09440 [Cellulomonas cellasea]
MAAHGGEGELVEHVRGVLGLPAWLPRQGHGSFLTFEFGERRDRDGHEHGEWHLWVQMAAWRIEDAHRVLAACEDDRQVIGAALSLLDRRPLSSIVATGPALDTVFDFSGVLLRTFGVESQRSADDSVDNWWMRRPDGQVVAVTTAGSSTLSRADA